MEVLIDGIWELILERFISCYEEIIRFKWFVGDLEKLV